MRYRHFLIYAVRLPIYSGLSPPARDTTRQILVYAVLCVSACTMYIITLRVLLRYVENPPSGSNFKLLCAGRLLFSIYKAAEGGEVEIFMPITVLLLRATYLVKETVGQEFFLCIAWV
jgi:hypothetical protein